MNGSTIHPSAADRLEALARRPLYPRRALLLDLAERLRALDALHVEEHQGQLEVGGPA